MTLIWDGASYHRSQIVKDAAAALDIKIEPLRLFVLIGGAALVKSFRRLMSFK